MLFRDVVQSAAEKYGDRDAYRAGERRCSFVEFRERVFRLANALATIAEPGDRVAILSQNTPEYLESYSAVPVAGMALTFLNYRLAPPELARIVDDAGASVLLVEDRYLPVLASIRASIPSVHTVVVFGDADWSGADAGDLEYEDLLRGAPSAEPTTALDEDDLAWLIYTSGTTGMPKGAMLSHRNVMTGVMAWMVQTDNRNGRGIHLLTFPLCHVAGISVLTSALLGSTLIAPRSFDPLGAMEAIDDHGVTSTSLAPTMLGMLLDHPRIDDFELSTLETISYGGSSITAELLGRAMRRFPEASFVQGYGMTELAGNALYMDPATHREAVDRPELLVSAGRSMAMSRLRLVDEQMDDVAVGDVGEIVVRGDQVMRGYWNREEATAEVFRGGWLHTGDLGRSTPDGYVAIVDRMKDMIVSGGENVYSREVEEVVAAVPGVAEVAVIGVPDEQWGETVVAVVRIDAGADVDADRIVAECRAQLAGYKRPRRVILVEDLPKNAGGKVLKRELRDAVLADPAARR